MVQIYFSVNTHFVVHSLHQLHTHLNFWIKLSPRLRLQCWWIFQLYWRWIWSILDPVDKLEKPAGIKQRVHFDLQLYKKLIILTRFPDSLRFLENIYNHTITSYKMLNIKRLKPFVLVISMLCFCVMGVLTIFFSRYENKVCVSRNLPQATKQSAVSFDLKTSLDHLRNSFEMSLDQYNYSTRNFSEKFREARLRSELFYRKLDSRSERHFVCNNGLFLLIQVHSSPANFKSRQGIRLTWGNMERFISHDHQDINRNYTLR